MVKRLLLLLILLAGPAQAAQTVYVIDQLDRFGDIAQVYRNDSTTDDWIQQFNVSEGYIECEDGNASYVIQLTPDQSVVYGDVTNSRWASYQISTILYFIAGFVLLAVLAVGVIGTLTAMYYYIRRRERRR